MSRPLQRTIGVLIGEPTLTISPIGRCRFAAPFETPLHTPGRRAAPEARLVADLVVVGPVAERAYAQFTAGDRFLAEGAWIALPGPDDQGGDGLGRHAGGDAVEFFAHHLGHDLAQHRYAVDRTRRTTGWQPHTPAHLLTADWAEPLLKTVAVKRPVAP